MADAADAAEKALKVSIAQSVLRRFGSLTVNCYPHPFSHCQGLAAQDYRHVIAAVHSREARREIQMETPQILWDAGATQDGDFRVWRMMFGETECMYCKHPRSDDDLEIQKSAQLSKLLQLDRVLCLRKIKDHEPFTEAEAAAIAKLINRDHLDFAPPKPMQRFNDWEQEQCGKLKLPNIDDEVPIPFAPVMAGVLLAGEILKEQYFPQYVLDSRYSNTLMGQFMTRSRPFRMKPRDDCKFCNDAIYRKQFERRWANPTALLSK